eukprot:4109444-Pyramimonas_sp.AAC.1
MFGQWQRAQEEAEIIVLAEGESPEAKSIALSTVVSRSAGIGAGEQGRLWQCSLAPSCEMREPRIEPSAISY